MGDLSSLLFELSSDERMAILENLHEEELEFSHIAKRQDITVLRRLRARDRKYFKLRRRVAFWGRTLEIKEMPLQEKYDRLLQNYLLGGLMDKVLHDELGAADKYNKLSVEMQKKMAPSLLGPIFKLLKTIAPGRSFKQLVEQYVYTMETTIPLSNLDLSWVSDREAVVTVKNCPMRQKMAELVKKTGANVNANEFCETESQINVDAVKGFGVDLAWQHTENGCKWTAKI